MRLSTCASVVAAVTLLGGAAGAHHNMSALFDFNDRVTVSGTLTKVDWRNPHIYVFVDGKTTPSQAATEAWSIEGPPPSFFRAREINRTDIEGAIGKAVTAELSRARDGTSAGLLRMMTLPDGKVISACPQNC